MHAHQLPYVEAMLDYVWKSPWNNQSNPLYSLGHTNSPSITNERIFSAKNVVDLVISAYTVLTPSHQQFQKEWNHRVPRRTIKIQAMKAGRQFRSAGPKAEAYVLN